MPRKKRAGVGSAQAKGPKTPYGLHAPAGEEAWEGGPGTSTTRGQVVDSMVSMFPNLDPQVVYIVLVECDFSADVAMDSLLELSGAVGPRQQLRAEGLNAIAHELMSGGSNWIGDYEQPRSATNTGDIVYTSSSTKGPADELNYVYPADSVGTVSSGEQSSANFSIVPSSIDDRSALNLLPSEAVSSVLEVSFPSSILQESVIGTTGSDRRHQSNMSSGNCGPVSSNLEDSGVPFLQQPAENCNVSFSDNYGSIVCSTKENMRADRDESVVDEAELELQMAINEMEEIQHNEGSAILQEPQSNVEGLADSVKDGVTPADCGARQENAKDVDTSSSSHDWSASEIPDAAFRPTSDSLRERPIPTTDNSWNRQLYGYTEPGGNVSSMNPMAVPFVFRPNAPVQKHTHPLPKQPWPMQAPPVPRQPFPLSKMRSRSKEGKVLFVLRGLPGSGKSTLARNIKEQGPNGVILSTDDYFVKNGTYCYDPSVLGEAHEWNHKRARDAMDAGMSPIIIDNTNTHSWEMRPYVAMALQRKYKIVFKEPETPWKFKTRELEKRNVHGISREKIVRMLNNYERHMTVERIMGSFKAPLRDLISCCRQEDVKGKSKQMLAQTERAALQQAVNHENGSLPCAGRPSNGFKQHSLGNTSSEGAAVTVNKNIEDNSDARSTENIILPDVLPLESRAVAEGLPKTLASDCQAEVIEPDKCFAWSKTADSGMNAVDNQVTDNPIALSMTMKKRTRTRRLKSPAKQIPQQTSDLSRNEFDPIDDWPSDTPTAPLGQRVRRQRHDSTPNTEEVESQAAPDLTICHLPGCETAASASGEVNESLDAGNAQVMSIEKLQEDFEPSATQKQPETDACMPADIVSTGPGEGADMAEEDNEQLAVSIDAMEGSHDPKGAAAVTSMPRSAKTVELVAHFSQALSLQNDDNTVVDSRDKSARPLDRKHQSTHTAPEDFALIWKVTKNKLDSVDPFVVVCGNPDRFTIRNEAVATADEAGPNIPYKLKLDKGILTDDMENPEPERDAEYLVTHFRSVSREVLVDIYEKCNRNLNWTVNVLIESGVEMSEEISEKETDTEVSSFIDEDVLQRIETMECSTKQNTQVLNRSRNEVSLGHETKGADCERTLVNNDVNRVEGETDNPAEREERDCCEYSAAIQDDSMLDRKIITSIDDKLRSSDNRVRASETVTTWEQLAAWTAMAPGNLSNASLAAPVLEAAGTSETPPAQPAITRGIEIEAGAVPRALSRGATEGSAVGQVREVEGDDLFDKGSGVGRTAQPLAGDGANSLPHLSTLEFSLPHELAIQLIELFGSIGLDEFSLAPEDLAVRIDMKMAQMIHQHWKDSVMVYARLSHLMMSEDDQAADRPSFSQNRGPPRPGSASNATSGRRQQWTSMPVSLLLGPSVDEDLWDSPYAPSYRQSQGQPSSLLDIMSEELASQLSREEGGGKTTRTRKDVSAKLKEQKLFELFPGIDRQFLMDVYRDHDYSLDSTQQFLSSVLATGTSPARTVVASDVYSENERQELRTALRLSLQEHALHGTGGAGIPATSSPSQSVAGPRGQDSDDAAFQDTEAPDYADFRAEAFAHHQRRRECFQRAAEACHRGMRDVAMHYARQGHLHGEKMKESNALAAHAILQQRNVALLPHSILDLHGLHVGEATAALADVLEQRQRECQAQGKSSVLSVITGQGNNSRGGVSRLKPAVLDYLRKNKYRWDASPSSVDSFWPQCEEGLSRTFLFLREITTPVIKSPRMLPISSDLESAAGLRLSLDSASVSDHRCCQVFVGCGYRANGGWSSERKEAKSIIALYFNVPISMLNFSYPHRSRNPHDQ
ncbi:unnamed protein product [Lampetra fluviatilis]